MLFGAQSNTYSRFLGETKSLLALNYLLFDHENRRRIHRQALCTIQFFQQNMNLTLNFIYTLFDIRRVQQSLMSTV